MHKLAKTPIVRWGALFTAALSMGGVILISPMAHASSAPLPCDSTAIVVADDVETLSDPDCAYEYVRIDVDGARFSVPRIGTVVEFNTLRSSDSPGTGDISIARAPSGGVAVESSGIVTGSPDAQQGLPAMRVSPSLLPSIAATDFGTKCATLAPYATTGIWLNKLYSWRYNATNEANAGSLIALTAAMDSIQYGESTICGDFANNLDMQRGANTYWDDPAVNTDNSCGATDGINVVGWGPIDDSGVLAATCRWKTFATNWLIEADIKFDTSGRLWTTMASACSGNYFDIQGIATHEFGHAVGLDHAPAGSQQIMEPAISPCNTDWRELGRGDQRGLEWTYHY